MNSRATRAAMQLVGLALGLALCSSPAMYAQNLTSVTLEWDANSESDLGGYTVYYGHSSRDYAWQRDAGNSTSITITGLDYCQRYYFAVTAYNSDHSIESGYSNEVSTDIPCSAQMWVDTPATGQGVSGSFTISGWAVDLLAVSGAGVDAVHVWADPADGSPDVFLGSATLGINRTDIGNYFGDSQFDASGFRLQTTQPLASGNYTLGISARSTVTGTFNNYKLVDVSVTADTHMWLDTPGNGWNLAVPFSVSGWALNTGATSGVGIDYIHVWAFPQTNPNNPIWLGLPTLGMRRPDVASYFGSSFYEPSGFRLNVTTPLAPGVYTVTAYVHSSVTGDFDASQSATVTVGSEIMFVDAPAPGSTLTTPFTVRGWAVDRAATSGTGVNAIHIWAVPQDGSPSIWVGSASLGFNRPDVGSFLGDSRFNPSGFRFDVTSLGPGTYTLWINARSTVTGNFTNATSINVTIQ